LTTYEADAAGNQIPKEQTIDILIFDNSIEVNTLISKAGEYINGGSNQDAMDILIKLVDEQKIQI